MASRCGVKLCCRIKTNNCFDVRAQRSYNAYHVGDNVLGNIKITQGKHQVSRHQIEFLTSKPHLKQLCMSDVHRSLGVLELSAGESRLHKDELMLSELGMVMPLRRPDTSDHYCI